MFIAYCNYYGQGGAEHCAFNVDMLSPAIKNPGLPTANVTNVAVFGTLKIRPPVAARTPSRYQLMVPGGSGSHAIFTLICVNVQDETHKALAIIFLLVAASSFLGLLLGVVNPNSTKGIANRSNFFIMVVCKG